LNFIPEEEKRDPAHATHYLGLTHSKPNAEFKSQHSVQGTLAAAPDEQKGREHSDG
jgi:hypothetical protein